MLFPLKKAELLRTLLILLGSLSLALGVIGIVLPLLPTTPFLLLAAFCFLRSSHRLHQWLLRHRILGPYIDNYVNHRALSLRAKVGTLSLLWLSLGGSIYLFSSPYLRLLLAGIGIAVTWHVLSLHSSAASKQASTPGKPGGDAFAPRR